MLIGKFPLEKKSVIHKLLLAKFLQLFGLQKFFTDSTNTKEK